LTIFKIDNLIDSYIVFMGALKTWPYRTSWMLHVLSLDKLTEGTQSPNGDKIFPTEQQPNEKNFKLWVSSYRMVANTIWSPAIDFVWNVKWNCESVVQKCEM